MRHAHAMRPARATARLAAAVLAGRLPLSYKSEICMDHRCGTCQEGLFCNHYHSEAERLPEIGYRTRFCPILQVRPSTDHTVECGCKMRPQPWARPLSRLMCRDP